MLLLLVAGFELALAADQPVCKRMSAEHAKLTVRIQLARKKAAELEKEAARMNLAVLKARSGDKGAAAQLQNLEKKLAENQAAILATFQEQAGAEQDDRELVKKMETCKTR